MTWIGAVPRTSRPEPKSTGLGQSIFTEPTSESEVLTGIYAGCIGCEVRHRSIAVVESEQGSVRYLKGLAGNKLVAQRPVFCVRVDGTMASTDMGPLSGPVIEPEVEPAVEKHPFFYSSACAAPIPILSRSLFTNLKSVLAWTS